MTNKASLSIFLDNALDSLFGSGGARRKSASAAFASQLGMSLLGQTWLPELDGTKWNLPTAVNLAAIAALSYGNDNEQGEGSPLQVFQALKNGGQEPRLFGKTAARMILRQYPAHYAFSDPVQLTRLGVTLNLSASPLQGLIFIQGTDSLTTALLDTALFNVGSDLSQTLRNALRSSDSFAANALELAIKALGLDIDYLHLMRHRGIILDYLENPLNQGAHLGFFLVLSAFLADGEFNRLFYAHNMQLKQVFITGHSLGAALALLLARAMQPYCEQRLLLHTFGSPKIGSADFIRGIPGKILHYRVVNNHDPIPLLPPGKNWKHHGKIRFIQNEQDPALLLSADQGYLGLPGYHGIQRYCDELTEILLHEAGVENPEDYGWLTPKPISL